MLDGFCESDLLPAMILGLRNWAVTDADDDKCDIKRNSQGRAEAIRRTLG